MIQNLTGKICVNCKTPENAINLMLKEGRMRGGPSSRGGVCEADEDGGFLAEEIKQQNLRKVGKFQKLGNILIYTKQRESGDKAQNTGVEVKAHVENAKEF